MCVGLAGLPYSVPQARALIMGSRSVSRVHLSKNPMSTRNVKSFRSDRPIQFPGDVNLNRSELIQS